MTAGNQHIDTPESVTRGDALSKLTTLKLGGPADYFSYPTSLDQLLSVTSWARENGLPLMVIGGGSNLFFKDTGYRGVVINLSRMGGEILTVSEKQDEEVLLSVPAGAKLPVLCSRAIRGGLSGLLFACGIPGTVGGALYMNAGTLDGSMGDIVSSITALLPGGKLEIFKKERLSFSYRQMNIIDTPCTTDEMIFTGCCINLKKGDPASLKDEADKRLLRRKSVQPTGTFNAGSFFKNPAGDRSAGALIDAAGLKGFSFGGAMVSLKHANFLINTGGASSEDMLNLMDHVKSKVLEKFDILLEPEVKIIG